MVDAGLIRARRHPGGARGRAALPWPNDCISTALGAAMRAAAEMLVELAFVVVEHEQRARVLRLANHPIEVAFLPRTDKAALQDPDHEWHPRPSRTFALRPVQDTSAVSTR